MRDRSRSTLASSSRSQKQVVIRSLDPREVKPQEELAIDKILHVPQKLVKLKDARILTEKEFVTKKEKLLREV